MFRDLRTSCGGACVSDLRFDAWLAGQVDEDEERALRVHLASCARCRSREAALRTEREEFHAAQPGLPPWLALHDADPVGTETRASSRLRRFVGSPSWLLAAAAVAVLALATRTRAPVRTKGSDYVSFYVKRGEDVRRGRTREQVRAGDKLRFSYTAARPRYLAILSLDGAHRANVYFPAGAQAVRVEAGTDVLLPSAVELDDAPGEERILALFCDRPLQVEQLRAALQARQASMPAPGGCALDQLVVIKEATTP